MNTSVIPVVSLSGIREERSRWNEAATAIGQACREIGFFVVTEHGVPRKLLDNAVRNATRFFALDHSEKMQLHLPDRGRGYHPFASERLGATLGDYGPGDLKETLNLGPDMNSNVWPASPAQFRSVFEALFASMHELTRELLHLCETALDLPEGRLDDYITLPKAILRTTLYPALKSVPEANQVRASAHTDYGTLTVLYPDGNVGGLQARRPNGDWVDVGCPAQAFVVNIGDIMQRWTNDFWKSVLHRVIIPEGSNLSTRDRLSIVFLHNPTPTAVVAPLPEFVHSGNLARYDSIAAEQYLCQKSASSRNRSEAQ